MSIFSYESFATYGALDSDAFTDVQHGGGPEILGASYSSHLLRTMGMDHNRLMTKPELLFNLVWPVATHITGNDGSTVAETFGGVAVSAWREIHPRIPVFKKHGHTLLNFRMTIRLSVRDNAATDASIQVQVCTGATPFNPAARAGGAAPNVIDITQNQNDGFVDNDISDIRMLDGSRDEIRVYAAGEVTTTAPSTGTYGSPASGTLNQSGDAIFENAIVDASATWNVTNATNRTLATEGYVIVFTDLSARALVSPRKITAIDYGSVGGTGRIMSFEPWLSPSELVLVRGTLTYVIFAIPEFWIGNLMGYSAARSQ